MEWFTQELAGAARDLLDFFVKSWCALSPRALLLLSIVLVLFALALSLRVIRFRRQRIEFSSFIPEAGEDRIARVTKDNLTKLGLPDRGGLAIVAVEGKNGTEIVVELRQRNKSNTFGDDTIALSHGALRQLRLDIEQPSAQPITVGHLRFPRSLLAQTFSSPDRNTRLTWWVVILGLLISHFYYWQETGRVLPMFPPDISSR